MKYVSEDNRRYSPVSIVDRVYGRNNTKYSMGNGNLEDVIDRLLSFSNEEIIVYVDVVPGNNETISVFFNLLRKYRDFSNVYIVPILCTEACLLDSLVKLGIQLNSVQIGILTGTVPYKSTVYSDANTLEKALKLFYKHIDVLKEDLSYYNDNDR